MLKKRRERKRKKVTEIVKKNRYKIDNKYWKAKIKNLDRVWNFKNTMLKKRRRKINRKEEKNKVTKIIKKI